MSVSVARSVFKMHAVKLLVTEKMFLSCVASGGVFVVLYCNVGDCVFFLTGQQLSLEPAGQFCQGHSCWDGEFKEKNFFKCSSLCLLKCFFLPVTLIKEI